MNILWNPRRFKKVALVLSCALAVYALLVYSTGYPTISGTIVDAETGQPVEGAVALCVWTYTIRVIESSHRVAKVSEGISDAQGRVKIHGTWNIFIDPAELTIYKRGYVAWNNQEKFIPAIRFRSNPNTLFKRTDFSWKNGFVAGIEKWKDEYSFMEHEGFISRWTSGAQTEKFRSAIRWESELYRKEMDRINDERRRKGELK